MESGDLFRKVSSSELFFPTYIDETLTFRSTARAYAQSSLKFVAKRQNITNCLVVGSQVALDGVLETPNCS